MTDSADRRVREVLDEVYAAWAANDADAFVRPYAETATATLPGAYLPSRKAVREVMATLFAGDLKGSSAVHEVQDIRFIAGDVAVVASQEPCSSPARRNRTPRAARLRPGSCPVRTAHGASRPSTAPPRKPPERKRGTAMPGKAG